MTSIEGDATAHLAAELVAAKGIVGGVSMTQARLMVDFAQQ